MCFLLCRIGRVLVAFEPVAGAFQSENLGVVHDPRGGDSGVAENLAPEPEERLLVMISDACSYRLAMSWKNRFAAS